MKYNKEWVGQSLTAALQGYQQGAPVSKPSAARGN